MRAGGGIASRRLRRMYHHVTTAQSVTTVTQDEVVMPQGSNTVSVASDVGLTGDRNSETSGDDHPLQVTQQEHAVLEPIFPSGNDVSCWGTHLHPLVSRVVSRLIFCGWSVRSWHRYFGQFTTTQWAEFLTENEGRGSRWTVQEWQKYFVEYKHFY